MSDFYILKGHNAVPVDVILVWGKWFQDNDRRIARDDIEGNLVSTVFLGVDHGWGQSLLLFETMIFADPNSHGECYCERCGTWDEAIAQHTTACNWVRAGKPKRD